MKSLYSTLVLISVLTLACSIGGAPTRVVKGQVLPAEKLSLVAEGMTSAQVEGLLGLPLRVTTKGDTVIWHYFSRERKDDLIRLLGLIPFRRALAIWETEVDVILIDDTVHEIRHFDRRIK